MQLLFAVLVVSVLMGCSGLIPRPRPYNVFIEPWVGQDESTLVSAWGVPDKQVILQDGSKAYEYDRSSRSYTVNRFPGGGVDEDVDYCSTLFILKDGKVTAFHYHGNACYGAYAKRVPI